MNTETAICRHCGASVPEGADHCPICERAIRRPWLPGWSLPGIALALCGVGILFAAIAPGMGLGFGAAATLAAGMGMGFKTRLRYPALAIAVMSLVGLGIWFERTASDPLAAFWQAQMTCQAQALLVRMVALARR